ncbi:hypothetical protein ACH4NV_33485 [Streptomyces althioticus]|uniref:hypothetical protein n=1 Tax=Streptomyces althioticus group TaxID=2867194 RepID=UPI0014315FD9|nr:hypothetical protein [Streptomyces griseorubens]WTC27318.1 hypothetical protein OG872_33605 [Streptomyces althioticus]GGQ39341.1 hypothetical protein GCM10010250_06410 [Streptomyces althioticus]
MSTPAPDSTPFDPHAFPADLVATQRQAAELYAALRAHQATLHWPREPHDGWPEEMEQGKEHPDRPASPGWAEAKAAGFDRLLPELRTITAQVQCHLWWKRCAAEGIKGRGHGRRPPGTQIRRRHCPARPR